MSSFINGDDESVMGKNMHVCYGNLWGNNWDDEWMSLETCLLHIKEEWIIINY